MYSESTPRSSMMKVMLMTMLMVMIVKETTGIKMRQVPGGLKSVSVGPAGVWGVNSADYIYYRDGTYGTNGVAGSGWRRVPGLLKQLDVGYNGLWGVNRIDDIYFRQGITAANPVGTSWIKVAGKLKHITVDPDGVVWGVNGIDNIYFRVGASNSNPLGTSWRQIPGKLKQISAGTAGVWGVNVNNYTYYRANTFNTGNLQGTTWVWVRDMKLSYVSSAFANVFGINDGKLFIRRGMSPARPTGQRWRHIRRKDENLTTVDSMFRYFWATKSGYSIWYSYLLLHC